MRAAVLAVIGALTTGSAAGATLELQTRIQLPDCKGRIDHLAFDAERRRLFVAELGNGSVAIIDLDRRQLERRLEGLEEPQGIAFSAPLQRLYVAEGGNGTVRAYDARDYRQLNRIKLAGDADNIRIDDRAKRLYVGYGGGALAVLDPGSLELMGDIRLKSHPESFQLSPGDVRIYVNVPGANEIAVVEHTVGKQVASFEATRWSANYPMTLDVENQAVLSVFRKPARIARYSMKDGSILADGQICGDADDVFLDAKRKRVYVICGEGVVDILDQVTLKRIGQFSTSPGARTGLYSIDADLLFIAARAEGGNEAAVWVLRPVD